MTVSFEVFSRGPNVLYGTCAGIWVMILYRQPQTSDMLQARPSLKATMVRHPEGFPTLTWVLQSAGLSIESDARRTAADITREYAEQIKGRATLIEGVGFQAATVRSILSGIDLMTRGKAPKQVFGDLRSCIEWCITLCPNKDHSSILSIVTAIEAVRATLLFGSCRWPRNQPSPHDLLIGCHRTPPGSLPFP